MPKPFGSSSSHRLLFSAVVAVAAAYAALRYNVFAGVPWGQLPLFVSNKGLSMASVTLIGGSYLVGRFRWSGRSGSESRRAVARAAGLAGFGLAVIHVFVSFAVLGPPAYPGLFDGGVLSLAGWVCLLFGALATALLALPAIYSFPRWRTLLGAHRFRPAQLLGYAALALTAGHVLSVGAHNWTAVSAWPGGLPPISLLSFIACVVPLGAKAFSEAAAYRAGFHFVRNADPRMGVRE
jgi:hypothetical protein